MECTGTYSTWGRREGLVLELDGALAVLGDLSLPPGEVRK